MLFVLMSGAGGGTVDRGLGGDDEDEAATALRTFAFAVFTAAITSAEASSGIPISCTVFNSLSITADKLNSIGEGGVGVGVDRVGGGGGGPGIVLFGLF